MRPLIPAPHAWAFTNAEFSGIHDVLGIDLQALACFSQFNPTAQAMEKRSPYLPFQLAYLLAQGRLSNAQVLGGTGEMQRISHGQEIFELPDIHIFFVLIQHV